MERQLQSRLKENSYRFQFQTVCSPSQSLWLGQTHTGVQIFLWAVSVSEKLKGLWLLKSAICLSPPNIFSKNSYIKDFLDKILTFKMLSNPLERIEFFQYFTNPAVLQVNLVFYDWYQILFRWWRWISISFEHLSKYFERGGCFCMSVKRLMFTVFIRSKSLRIWYYETPDW